MLITLPPQRKRPSRAKVRVLSQPHFVPPPPPETTVTVVTDAASYPIDPAITVTVTITDTQPSTSGYTLEISYSGGDSGGWQTVGTGQPLGPNYFNPAVQFPEATPSGHCLFRATNNDTAQSGVSNEFALTAE